MRLVNLGCVTAKSKNDMSEEKTKQAESTARERKSELQRIRREEKELAAIPPITVAPDQLRDNLASACNRMANSGRLVTVKWLAGQERAGRLLWPSGVVKRGVTFKPWR